MFPGGVVFDTVDSCGISSGTTRKYVNCTCRIVSGNIDRDSTYFMYTADTCDPSWQSTRDDIIIAANVISDLAFLIEVVAAGFLVGVICCGKYCKFTTIIVEDVP